LYHDEAITNAEWEKDINRHVEALAKKKGVAMAQIALAWVLHKDWVCAPIIGASKMERLDELVAALDIKLSEEDINYLEETYQP
jgi:aryl-alcohol dehydrogenase-like predicted oxidoreductase